MVTNLWDSDLHLNSILLPPISVAKLCSSSNNALNSKAGLRTRLKTRPENSFGNSPAQKKTAHNKTIAVQQQLARCRATCKHVLGFARRSHEAGMTKEQLHQCKHKPNEAKFTNKTLLCILCNCSTATKRMLGRLSQEVPCN